MKKIKYIILFILPILSNFLSLGQNGEKSILRDTGYLIFYEMDAVFIPSREVNDEQFLMHYTGEIGYKIGEYTYPIDLKRRAAKYKVVTNYVIKDSLMPETKWVGLIPVEISYILSPSILKPQISDILFRYRNKDYIFKYQSDGQRSIESAIPLRNSDKRRLKKPVKHATNS